MNSAETGRLFSVIILHYKQENLWKSAVDSVLKQNYPAIQLIFSDDGTPDLDTNDIEMYIKNNAQENLKSYSVLTREHNIGTVKNINEAYQYVVGYFVTLFAADDALFDEHVLWRYAKSLEKTGESVCGVCGQSLKCDADLKPTGENYIQEEFGMKCNQMTSKQQFVELTKFCYFPMGATAFIYSNFLESMPFSTQYHLFEDWPFFLRVTREGKRFLFADFPALLYRAGGISNTETVSDHKIEAFKDHLKLHDLEIWPYTKYLNLKELFELSARYDRDRADIKKLAPNVISMKRFFQIKYDFRYLLVIFMMVEKKYKQLFYLMGIWIIGLILLCFVSVPFYNASLFVKMIIWSMSILSLHSILWIIKEVIEIFHQLKQYLFSPCD